MLAPSCLLTTVLLLCVVLTTVLLLVRVAAVRGYAWSGGGRDIIRVDVSPDGGVTWAPATISKLPTNKPGRSWAWSLWEVTLPLPKGHTGPLELCCKATDESYNTQPESAAGVWNIRGLANNSWHRVVVDVGE